ncbi:MAG: hypothetical protein WAV51_02480 [Microgenomates group bacterium]
MSIYIAILNNFIQRTETDVLLVPFYGTKRIWINETANQLIHQSSGQHFKRKLVAYVKETIILPGEFISFSKEKLLCFRDNVAQSITATIPILLYEALNRNYHHIVIPLLRSHILSVQNSAEEMVGGIQHFFHFVQQHINITIVLGSSQISCLDFLQEQAVRVNKT